MEIIPVFTKEDHMNILKKIQMMDDFTYLICSHSFINRAYRETLRVSKDLFCSTLPFLKRNSRHLFRSCLSFNCTQLHSVEVNLTST